MPSLSDVIRDHAIAAAKRRSQASVTLGHLAHALRSNPSIVEGLEDRGMPEPQDLVGPTGTSINPPVVGDEVEQYLSRCKDGPSAQIVLLELLELETLHPQEPEPQQDQPVVAGPPPTTEHDREPSPARSFDEVMAELDSLIGLESVKATVVEAINVFRFNQARAETDRKSVPTAMHMVFSGNPGTGKTTVARLVAELFRSVGLLRRGHLVEVQRSDIVGEYVGHTGPLVEATVKRSLGGVLFIDEAYSLAPTSERDFGSEAIATLVKLMEDHRDDLVVIVAGYTGPMQEFIESNDGLRSRFQRFIDFPDYSDSELIEIVRLMAAEYELEITDDVAAALEHQFTNSPPELRRGNARYARNSFEGMYTRMASRVLADNVVTDDEHRGFSIEDLPPVVETKRKLVPGFVQPAG